MSGVNRHNHASSSGRGSSKSSGRYSNASLRANPASSSIDIPDSSPLSSSDTRANEGVDNGLYSLAHELAAVMDPDPNSSSRALAEELGLDFEEGEGNDEEAVATATEEPLDVDRFQDTRPMYSDSTLPEDGPRNGEDDDPNTRSASPSQSHDTAVISPRRPRNGVADDLHPLEISPDHSLNFTSRTEDPLQILAQDLISTDAFISNLRCLDQDTSSFPNHPIATRVDADHRSHPHHFSATTTVSSEPSVERYTSRMIRQLTDSVRERETQLRELISIDKEFSRIEGEMGGLAALGALDSLDGEGGAFEDEGSSERAVKGHLHPLEEEGHEEDEEEEETVDAEDEEHNRFDDKAQEDDDVFDESSPVSTRRRGPRRRSRGKDAGDSAPPPPVQRPGDPVSPSSTIPHLSYMRTLTSSLVSSLGSLSEYTQENGAATADAGRKIRSLKNKIASLQNEWDVAEKSQKKILEWENEPKVDGRTFVKEQLAGFEEALAAAATRTQAIMAS